MKKTPTSIICGTILALPPSCVTPKQEKPEVYPSKYDYIIESHKGNDIYEIFVINVLAHSTEVITYLNGRKIEDLLEIKDKEISDLIESLEQPYRGCIPIQDED